MLRKGSAFARGTLRFSSRVGVETGGRIGGERHDEIVVLVSSTRGTVRLDRESANGNRSPDCPDSHPSWSAVYPREFRSRPFATW